MPNIRFQMRRGTQSEWNAANPTLAAAEWGYETDTGNFKIGNGVDVWTALSYKSGAQTVVGNPYDLNGEVVGFINSGVVVFNHLAVRSFTIQAFLQSTGGAFATVKLQVDGSDVTLPQTVNYGQLVTAITTTSGTGNYFSVKGLLI